MWNSGPVGQHDRHAIAAPDPELGQPTGQRIHPLQQLGQVSETLSSGVRTATMSGWLAAVRRSASVSVGRPRASGGDTVMRAALHDLS